MGASGAMMAASMATKAYGAYQQSKAQQSSLDYQAAVAANNAQISQDQATVALNNGQTQAQTQDLKTASIFGEQRAQLAANGVDLGSGSANNILTTTQLMGARDHATIVDNAMKAAWGYQVQGADQSANSKALSTMSDNISPGLAVGSSLLGSASQVSSAWNTYAFANGKPNFGTSVGNLLSS
jgi:hypothetical protein